MLYTSYFAKLRFIRNGIVPIAICARMPEYSNIPRYSKLAPSTDILYQYNRYPDVALYRYRFLSEILFYLDPRAVAEELYKMSHNQDVALICYEGPGKFCHRHIVADWFIDAGIACEEYRT